MKPLSIIIVNYNVKHYLRQCLESLLRASVGIDVRIWVVDNHSSDDSVAALRPLFPQVQWIECHHNQGFSRANNLVLRQIDSEYVLLLNPDTIIGEDTLSACMEFMKLHPDAGAVGVKMLNSNGTKAMESRRGVPTPMTAFYKMIGLCKAFPNHKRLGHYYMSALSWDEPAQIEIVSGAFFFTKKSVVEDIGLLDQDFFMYGEDIDWAYRMLQAGYTNWYLPQTILHYKGESTQKSSFRYVHVFYKAMLIFLRKHFRHLRLWITLPIQFAIWCKALLTLIRVKLGDIRKSLGFTTDRYTFDIEYILVGEPAQRAVVKHIHRSTGILLSFMEKSDEAVENTPDAIIEKLGKNPTSVSIVYQTDVFPYKDILEMMEHHNSSLVEIGTANIEAKIIITRVETFTWT